MLISKAMAYGKSEFYTRKPIYFMTWKINWMFVLYLCCCVAIRPAIRMCLHVCVCWYPNAFAISFDWINFMMPLLLWFTNKQGLVLSSISPNTNETILNWRLFSYAGRNSQAKNNQKNKLFVCWWNVTKDDSNSTKMIKLFR